MPASYPIHLSLKKEQIEWLERECERTGSSRSKVVQDLIDEQMQGNSSEILLKAINDKLSRLEGQHLKFMRDLCPSIDSTLVYLKEVFRESSANLYRLNEVIENMPNPIVVRQKVNEFVRGREREVLERVSSSSQHSELTRG